jgi:1,3-beta-glucan synthase
MNDSVALRAAHLPGTSSAFQSNLALRKWASMRMQTFYRTVSGMMRTQQALELLLRTQVSGLSETELFALLKTKVTCVAAMQRYQQMTKDELADVEVLLAEFPLLTIAFVEKQGGQEGSDAPPRFFSCLIDGSCEYDATTAQRRPKFRIELPGYPILGNGKSDNQNLAIVFTRGTVIQTIE